MNQRTKDINKAIAAAKKRDDYKCIVCGRGHHSRHTVDGSHDLPRNGPFKRNDPTDPEGIATLCRYCHNDYGAKITPESKAVWWEVKGFPGRAERIRSITGCD